MKGTTVHMYKLILVLSLTFGLITISSSAQRTAMNYRGVYSSSITYQIGDTVTDSSGMSYVCLVSNNLANTPATTSADWRPLAPLASNGISGGVAGQVAVMGSSSTITSSIPVAGAGAGVVTGPIAGTTVNDLLAYTTTGGQSGDSGVAVASGTPAMSIGSVTVLWPASGGTFMDSLTTTGSGSATFVNGALNIPTPPTPVADITITVGTTSVPANSCLPSATTYNTATMTGLTAGMSVIGPTPATSVATVTGFTPASTGQLYFVVVPTSGILDWQICNGTGTAIIPSTSTTWNVGAF
jgi:hypothetical protein